jgi:L-lactate dehydrogenase complex protein LldG
MTARTLMLENIRSSLAKSAALESLYKHLQPSEVRPRRPASYASQQDLTDRFAAELTAVCGEVHRVANNESTFDAIRQILSGLKAKRIATSDIGLFEGGDLSGIEVVNDPSREDLFTVDAGISTAQSAIAETGTLVLRSSMEKHRVVSLVPPIHICVLKTTDIRPSMYDVLEELSNDIDPTITFITGPSRTSDIELTLAIGVHGPKRLIVVLID